MSKQNLLNVGSLLMVGFPGKTLDDSTINLVKEGKIHNFILFNRNVESREQLKELCSSLSALCLSNKLPKPLISIDQEGGSVTRLPPPFTQFPDQREIAGEDQSEEKLRDYARTCALELKETGINMNLAPVLDICPAGKGYFMERRSLGDNPRLVAEQGTLVFQEMQKIGVAACAKHFPGLGRAILDPHKELPVVSSSWDEMNATDLIPFKAASSAGIAALMTSHAVYKNLDPAQPATLSPSILGNILRQDMGFSGLLLTDDLEMGAIEEASSTENAALNAFMAGADLLLICQNHEKIRSSLKGIQQAYKDKIISRNLLKNSLVRQGVVRDLYG